MGSEEYLEKESNSHNNLRHWKIKLHPAKENRLNDSNLTSPGLKGTDCSALPAPMAVNPLEGLMSVAENHQLVSGCAAEPQSRQPAAAGGHKQSPRSGREPRKWVSEAALVIDHCQRLLGDCKTFLTQHAARSSQTDPII